MPTPMNGGSQHSTVTTQSSGSSLTDALLGPQRWSNDSGTLTLTYSFAWKNGRTATWDSSNYSSLREPDTGYGLSSQEQDAVRAALKAWSAVANINFVEVEESSTSVGDLRFAWTRQNNPGAAAWAYEPSSWWTSGGDVWLSSSGMSSYKLASDWLPGGGAFSTLMHEIGHALGLKHPFEDAVRLPTNMDSDQYTVMSYTQHPYGVWGTLDAKGTYNYQWLSPETPMLLDIAAMQSLYGANTQSGSGNDTYTLTPGAAILRTLWDAGGQDTLNLAAFSRGTYIDLQPGAFSSLPSLDAPPAWADKATYGKDNLAIAWGTVIENAIGGSGDDTLLGNSANNRLQGGSGNDTIDGREGLDTAVYSAARASYDIQRLDGNRYTVTQRNSGADGKDTLTSIERLQFSDQRVALDVANGDAGFTAQLIGAVYGAANARNPQLIGIGLKLLDGGTTHAQLAKMALEDRLGAGYGPEQFISALYQNLTGQNIPADQLSAWKTRVANGEFTDVSLTLAASAMTENNTNIGLTGMIDNGITYI
ncbi:M10 family metallopeptidase [Delftia sp. PS-11]|uniref:M10 family metallopeptidase n=1 Tax=Delftia sp. PS-11 TaxID=2767222 RepID=UPI00245474BF|nr:M10 family metallopeptidase [Delftia sp. PS-11]KAJ8745971.1 M10 family metallopeptidase C-terminal domain-containing protein [Delftia sp. PS-11]